MPDSIENIMAQSMESNSVPFIPQLPPVVTKIIHLIDRFIQKYGSIHIDIFKLPDNSPELQRFLNSLQITLRRQEIISSYAWQYHPAEHSYSLLIFHYSPIHGSISSTVHRLWHSSPPIIPINHIHVTDTNFSNIKDWLVRSLLSSSATLKSPDLSYHRRTYGSSFSI